MVMAQRLLEEEPDALPKALQSVIESRCGGNRKAVEAVLLSLLLEALQGDTKAAKELLDRAYGKVADKLEGGDPDRPVAIQVGWKESDTE